MIEFLIDALAAFRLTRLVVADSITEPIRDPFVAAHTTTEVKQGVTTTTIDKWAELVTCPWCMGMWVALGIAVVRRVFPRSWRSIARPLAVSAVAGMLGAQFE